MIASKWVLGTIVAGDTMIHCGTVLQRLTAAPRWLEPSDFGTCAVSAVWEVLGPTARGFSFPSGFLIQHGHGWLKNPMWMEVSRTLGPSPINTINGYKWYYKYMVHVPSHCQPSFMTPGGFLATTEVQSFGGNELGNPGNPWGTQVAFLGHDIICFF